jgi:hypothetical protein
MSVTQIIHSRMVEWFKECWSVKGLEGLIWSDITIHHVWLQDSWKHQEPQLGQQMFQPTSKTTTSQALSPQQTSLDNSSFYASRITGKSCYVDRLFLYYRTLLQLQMLQNIKWEKTTVMLVLDYFMTIAWRRYAPSNYMKRWLCQLVI